MTRSKIIFTLALGLLLTTSCEWEIVRKKSTKSETVKKENISDKEDINTAKSLKFTSYSTEIHSHIDNDKKLPACYINIDLSYPSGGNTGAVSLTKLQQLFIASLPDGMRGASPQAAADTFVESYIASYQNDMKPYRRKAKRGDNEWMNYETVVSTENLYNADDFWGYSVESYSYTGGAHGTTTTSYNVIDLKNGRPLLLKNLFAESDYILISRMLRQQLADELGVSVDHLADKSYEADNIVIDDNFMLGDKGITWLFNPYDIAPYSTGTTRITLPYRAIAGYLLPDSPLKRITSK